MNQAEVKKVAEEEGFDVIEFEPKYATSMRKAYELMSSSHAMIGVHGAALTHFLLLRPGSVFVQVVPAWNAMAIGSVFWDFGKGNAVGVHGVQDWSGRE